MNTHTGTGAEQVITLTDGAGAAVSPDFVWIKDRDGAVEHAMTDVVRGATKEQSLNDNGIDETVAQGLKSFDASGFTLGTDASYNSSGPYSSWSWVEGSTPGFDVLTYTGNATIRNISHNAGLAPGMMLFKDLTSSSDIQTWRMYHNGSHPTTPELRYEQPLSTAATAGSGTEWNSTAPTSSVFTLGTNDIINKNGETFVAYLWSEVEGYCKISQFEGNGAADGTFVYCGFRPAWIMLKSVDSTSSWFYYDSKRDGYNPVNDHFLFTTSAEVTATHLDILSNGFKLRIATVDPNVAETYLFTAFAEFPFGGDGVSQARAR